MYSFSQELKIHFSQGWRDPNVTSLSSGLQSWEYRLANQLDGYSYTGKLNTYSGGGYAQEFSRIFYIASNEVNLLCKDRWIDRHTRAVFVEASLYNPNSNLFTSITVLVEVPPTGGIFPKAEILTYRLYQYIGDFQLFVLACEVFCIMFMIYFSYREMKLIYRQKMGYFSVIWNWIEILVVVLSWTAVVYFFVCLWIRIDTLAKYRNDRSRFVNFQNINSWQQQFECTIAFLTFFVMLKYLKLLSFNKRMYLMTLTLRQAGKELSHFLLFAVVYYSACSSLYYLVMNEDKEEFSTVVKSTTKLLSVLLGRFTVRELFNSNGYNQDLNALMFILYMSITNFILINMLLAVIIESFKTASQMNKEMVNDFELVDFITSTLKGYLGIRTLNTIADTASFPETEKQVIADRSTQTEMREKFITRADQLTDSLQQLYDIQIAEEFIIKFLLTKKELQSDPEFSFLDKRLCVQVLLAGRAVHKKNRVAKIGVEKTIMQTRQNSKPVQTKKAISPLQSD